MKPVLIYTRFNRFWHWMQTLLVITMGITGFEIHGSYSLLGWDQAVRVHNFSAWSLFILVAFSIFWHFTTGTWKEYIPTTKNLGATLRYYTQGMFHNEKHPYKKAELSRLNPLQRLTYLGFKVLIFPVLATTGLYYMFPAWFAARGIVIPVAAIAALHTVAAILMVTFFIVHVYMVTTGVTVTSNIRAMISGYEIPPTEGDVASLEPQSSSQQAQA